MSVKPFLSVSSQRTGSLEEVWRGLDGVVGTLVVGLHVQKRASKGYMGGGSQATLFNLLFTLEYGNPNNRIPNTPQGNPAPIPPRPVITPHFQRHGKGYIKRFQTITMRHVESGANPKSAMESLGKAIVNDLVAAYRNADVEENSPVTLRLRRRNKSGPALIDRGRLLRAFTFVWKGAKGTQAGAIRKAKETDTLLANLTTSRSK